MFKRKEKSLTKKAEEINDVLVSLGIGSHTETGKQIRSAIAMELLSSEYELIGQHGKATFVKQHHEVIGEVRQLLLDEGVLTRPATKSENKKRKE